MTTGLHFPNESETRLFRQERNPPEMIKTLYITITTYNSHKKETTVLQFPCFSAFRGPEQVVRFLLALRTERKYACVDLRLNF